MIITLTNNLIKILRKPDIMSFLMRCIKYINAIHVVISPKTFNVNIINEKTARQIQNVGHFMRQLAWTLKKKIQCHKNQKRWEG